MSAIDDPLFPVRCTDPESQLDSDTPLASFADIHPRRAIVESPADWVRALFSVVQKVYSQTEFEKIEVIDSTAGFAYTHDKQVALEIICSELPIEAHEIKKTIALWQPRTEELLIVSLAPLTKPSKAYIEGCSHVEYATVTNRQGFAEKN